MTKIYAHKLVRKFTGDTDGATAIEYGLIAAGIAVLLVAGIAAVGGSLTATFAAIVAALG